MKDANEEILTLSGKVTGSVRVVWQSNGRAFVTDGGYGREDVGRLTYKGNEYRLFHADFRKHSGTKWQFQTGSVPIRKGNSSFNDPAPPTYMRAMLDAIAEALAGAYTVDKARSANVSALEQAIERAESEEAALLEKLTEVRDRLLALRSERKLYGD